MNGRIWWLGALVVGLTVALLVTTFGFTLTSTAAQDGPSAAAPLDVVTGNVAVGSFSSASAIPSAFWGVNVAAAQRFDPADAAAVAATPVTYLRFPAGVLAEEFNYTSGVITSLTGARSDATTSTKEFVTSCKKISCRAIMQLPAEIDSPATAADYASYVVHTLGYQPAYWEIGNGPAGWTHFDVPWSEWKSKGGGNTTPLPFANLVHAYIAAVLKVDPAGQFLALGAGMGAGDYSKPWVEELAKVDGKELAGISVHSYIEGGPSNPTDAELFANLNGVYSLPAQVPADQSYIKAACPSCTKLQIFVSEINAAEDSPYSKLLPTFAGTLYIAAETVQGLTLHVANLDWFAYDSDYAGSWSRHPMDWQKQYYLFSDLMTHLYPDTLPTTVTGPSTLYGIATYGQSGLALLLVNVGTTSAVEANVASAGFVLGRADVTEYSWQSSAKQPSKETISLTSTVDVPAESIVLLTVSAGGMKSPVPVSAAATPETGATDNPRLTDPLLAPSAPIGLRDALD